MPLIHLNKNLVEKDKAVHDIQNQVRQVILHYMGLYVDLVNESEEGIKSRYETKKKGNKKRYDDSDDSVDGDEEGKERFTLSTSRKSMEEKGHDPNEMAYVDPNIVTLDLTKTTRAQANYVSKLLSTQKQKAGKGKQLVTPKKTDEIATVNSPGPNKRKLTKRGRKPGSGAKKAKTQKVVEPVKKESGEKEDSEEENSDVEENK